MLRDDAPSITGRGGQTSRDGESLSADSTTRTVEADREPSADRTDIQPGNRRLERGLWIVFGVLFGTVVFSVYVPVDPIVFVFPLWSLLVLAAMVTSVAVAAVAGIGYGWPGEDR
ncbi:hypothetical protein ACERIT_14150 [Halopenitus sp. H-Gu1]|uniref:hypothetical protein n=1 Tax=Halopenitus sp. H-Gu1 TaxID=3242697 RepID=UPI00359EE0EF